MLGFMDYVQNAFYTASHWNPDNLYPALTATARELLDFETPCGIRLNVSSLASPNLATSYTIGSVGVVDGSVSYLYSSLPLSTASRSTAISLRSLIPGYRNLREIRTPDQSWWWEIWHRGQRVDQRDALLYGRFFLPANILEALYIRRLSPTRQLRLSCVSDSTLPNGGTILALLQTDYGKYSMEYLYSTDSGLLGVRGLYNLGDYPRKNHPLTPTTAYASENVSSSSSGSDEGIVEPEIAHGRFSAGAELYYGLLNKSGGMSTGLRFTTLPTHTGFPYTMTLTLNPLMGNLSSTYAVKAGHNLSLASRFDFNFYSYESGIQLAVELWRHSRPPPEIEWAVKRIRPDWKAQPARSDEDVTGVVKARVDQNFKVGVLWEGRVKELLVTLGLGVDLKKREQIFRAVGIEVQYSS